MIELPPKITSAIDCRRREIMSSENPKAICEAVARVNYDYLYWSDVKYRARALGLAPEVLWAIVKNTRAKSDIQIPGFANLHFSLSNRMQRLCHEFDMDFGGTWGASKIFPDDKTTQELYLISSIMEEAIASSQMEGAATTREVAKDMLRKRISPRDKSQRMIQNNYTTINFIREHYR
ncbi:MAG: cell filamentation protein Fic, partial [Duncaniella sp.]|nr:cell filamentation protein Fic [Duncaniella sp.]